MTTKNEPFYRLPLPPQPVSQQPLSQPTHVFLQQQQQSAQQLPYQQQQQQRHQEHPFSQQTHRQQYEAFQQQQSPSIQHFDMVPLRELTIYSAPVHCPKCLYDGPTKVNKISTTTPSKYVCVDSCFLGYVPKMTSRAFEHTCSGCGAALAKYHVKQQPDIPGMDPVLDFGTTEVVVYAGEVVEVQPKGYPGMAAL